MTTVVVISVLVYLGMLLAGLLIRWQAAKGLTVAATPFGLFLFSGRPREIVALGGAGLLLLSRKLHSRRTSDGALLALSSTLAGNLLVVGSIANIIVIDAAARRDIHITWREHARIGVPMTLSTLGISAVYLLR